MDKLINILSSIIDRKASSKRIGRIIQNLRIKPSSNLKKSDKNLLTIGSAQIEIKIFSSISKYIKEINNHIYKSVTGGAQLVVFPEFNGVLLFGLFPFFKIIINIINNFKTMSSAEKQSFDIQKDNNINIDIIPLYKHMAPILQRIFIDIFSTLAKAHRIYIMSGSILVFEQEKLYNRNYFFAPDGSIIDCQDKVHLTTDEKNLGISSGKEFKVLQLPIGNISFPFYMDAVYFETFKILKYMGAQVVLLSAANMDGYTSNQSHKCIWSRVQESGFYGVNSALIGNFYKLTFTGNSSFFTPISANNYNSGISSTSTTKSDTIIQTLDLSLLDTIDDPYASDSNPSLYKKYMNSIYVS